MSTASHTKKQCVFQYDCEVAVAFQSDCENLLRKYESLQDTSYSKFCEVWKEMNFTMVFSKIDRALTLMEFVDKCFFIIKKFIVYPKSKYVQIGALYLLYGMYYKQPLEQWVKIRMTLEEFTVMRQLLELMKAEKNLEGLYVFSRMMHDSAFLYVASKSALAFEDRYIRSFHNYEDDTFQQKSSETVFESFGKLVQSSSIVKEMEDTEMKYKEAQRLCPEECKGMLEPKVSIMSELKVLNRRVNDICEEDLQEEEEDGEETTGQKRKRLREQAMQMCSAIYRGNKDIITAVDVSAKTRGKRKK